MKFLTNYVKKERKNQYFFFKNLIKIFEKHFIIRYKPNYTNRLVFLFFEKLNPNLFD
jgi:hypothetical protein